VSLGRNRARPSCTTALDPCSWRRLGPRAQLVCGPRPCGVRPVCVARGLRLPGRPRPARPATTRCNAMHTGAVTAPGRASRRGRRRRHSGRGDANGGCRAPTTVRLPAGHGGGGDSSPELLIDVEGEKTLHYDLIDMHKLTLKIQEVIAFTRWLSDKQTGIWVT
jgi:hypothetical protein